MEVSEDFGPKTTTPESPNLNPDLAVSNQPSKHREEGELSSEEEHRLSPPQEDQVLSASQCSSVDGASCPVPIPPANEPSEDVLVGKNVSGNNPTSAVDIQSQARTQPIAQKSFDKNRIPSKANTPGWSAPAGATDNLVIRFSDDSSGSDSEEHIKGKASESKSNTKAVIGTRKPPAPLNSKLNKHNSSAMRKVMPQRFPFKFNRAFTSTVTKVLGSNSSGSGTLSVEQGLRVKNFNSINKNMPNRERVSDRSMNLNNSKLQDLRQQIALRESELKLKSVQQNKESVPLKGDNATSLQTNATRRFTATSSTSEQMEPKEPEKKRKKVGGSFSTQLNTVGAQENLIGKSIIPSKEPAMQKNVIPVSVEFDQGPKGNSTGRTGSNIDKQHKQNEKQVPSISENIHAGLKSGNNAISNCVRSDGSSKQTDGSIMLNQAASSANMNSQFPPMNSNIVGLNPIKNQQSSSFSNKRIRGKDPVLDNHPEISNNKMLEPPLTNMYQDSESLWNCLSNANVAEYRSMNMQSMAEMEESLDKDLDEAQELRRRCEIEERNALKAYRKAQRALIEANAKCADLYHKREMYSAQLRSFIMGDSSLLCSSRQHDKVGIGYSNDMSRNMLLLPSSHQLQPAIDRFNPIERGSNFHYLNTAPVQKSYQHVTGQNVGLEPCSEPDASTSEPLSHRVKAAADGFCSPSNDPNISADDDDGSFSFENETVQHGLELRSKNNNFDDGENNLSREPIRDLAAEKPEDMMLLEATLRSELFARMGTRNSSKSSGSSDNIHLTFEQGTGNDVSSEKTPTNLENCLSSKAVSEGGGTDGREQSNSEAHVEMLDDCSIETDCLNSHALVDPGKESSCTLISDAFNVFRSAFSHLKIISPKIFMEWVSKNRLNYGSYIYDREDASIVFDKFRCRNPTAVSTCENNVELCGIKVGSYTCDIAVDPFWPLCMYELRGKCNNDECPWQHVRDNKAIMSRDQHGDSVGDAKIVSRYSDVMATPTYLVGLDTLKVDAPSYESVQAWRSGQGWKKCFSLSLTLSSLFLRDLPMHGPLSCGSEGRIEVHSSWTRQSSDFMSRSDGMMYAQNQLEQTVADNEHALETAILIFAHEADKLEGIKKALPILSRALEADPTSVYLWMFYLLIYHSNVKSVVADDMFSYAVKYNEGSYELWLMYINSRTHLDDRLATYDTALRALSRHASASNRDGVHASACILDLFLQMIECSCTSGNVEKAIQKVVELCSADTNSDKPSSLLSNVHSCLTISDKCVFWVCCVYVVIYKKLPDVVVQQFECDKQLLEIEWSSILLPDNVKQRAVELMEKGADYVASLTQTESLGSDTDLRSAQSFAVNYIRCMAAIESPECSNLLSKYLRLYPSCLELVLMSARAHKRDFEDASFLGFEKTLSNWPKETPGIQCIWNQYAQLFLQNGQFEFGKELMDRWYRFSWKVHDRNDGLPASAPDSTLESPPSLSQIDAVFGFLNLSLYKLLQNDRIGARIAIDKALKAVTPNYFKYCVREHAIFFLTEESLMKENASIGSVVNILKYHMGDYHVFSAPEPLPRKFFHGIKKPRVQQLVSNIFSPLSTDFSLVNLVLEVWFGPSLLPEGFKEPKHLVDFVERILDTWPSNYELALSLCKLLISRKNSKEATTITTTTTTSMLFWASSNLTSAIFHAVPIPPERAWVEAARILSQVKGIDDISQRFYRRALTAYPFSVSLWRSYQTFYVKMGGHAKTITEEAKAKGIDLG